MRILSGMRPTGRLHLGNYFGALRKWVELQDEGNDCYFCVVDWHSLTTDYADVGDIKQNIKEVVLDWLASGIDPEKSVIFVQSAVKEHAELHLLLSMITPLGWLTRVPTYKEQQNELKSKDLSTLGFLSYPVLQTADILLYKATGVPVGEDQLPHLELGREIIRRFNHFYKTSLPEPKSLLSPTPKINGTDGRKMSKSYDNAIYLADDDEAVDKAVMSMLTDPARARRKDPGDPEKCNLFPLHKIASSKETCDDVVQGCKSASLGCFDCKKLLSPNLKTFLQPMRERREAFAADDKKLSAIVEAGSDQARKVANETMQEVRQAMNLD